MAKAQDFKQQVSNPQSKLNIPKREVTRKDRINNYIYSGGAAIVLIGALMKITHANLGPITGGMMLTVGLLTEAFIFAVAAFDPPKPEYEWEKVYPELVGGVSTKKEAVSTPVVEHQLSEKLDKLMHEAQLDVQLISSLKDGIQQFKNSVEEMAKITNSPIITQEYSDQLSIATNHLQSLNTVYTQQKEESQKVLEYNKLMYNEMKSNVELSAEFSKQMGDLTANLANLNKVYGSMLSAMKS